MASPLAMTRTACCRSSGGLSLRRKPSAPASNARSERRPHRGPRRRRRRRAARPRRARGPLLPVDRLIRPPPLPAQEPSVTATVVPALPLLPTETERRPVRQLRWRTLFTVELRKMVDTRSGVVIVLATLAGSVAVLARKLATASVETSFHNYGGGVATIVAFA